MHVKAVADVHAPKLTAALPEPQWKAGPWIPLGIGIVDRTSNVPVRKAGTAAHDRYFRVETRRYPRSGEAM